MKKKWVIALSVLLVVVVTIVTLSFTLFTIQNIEIDMRTSSSQVYTSDEILKASQVSKGKNIMFLNKTAMTENLEAEYPYMQVINIETRFPYTLVFHLAERTAFYAIKSGEKYLKLDRDLKVLGRSDSADGLILIDGELNLQVGQFAQLENLKELCDAILACNRTQAEALATFEKLEYFESENDIYHTPELGIKLTLKSGREVYLHNCSHVLADKLAKFYSVLGQIYTLSGMLEDEAITTSQIHIENFIGSPQDGQTCYFYLMYQGEKVTI